MRHLAIHNDSAFTILFYETSPPYKNFSGDIGLLAQYCQSALERCALNGERKERPCRLETISILTRNPSTHTAPHSVSVLMADGEYAIVTFDGSSTVNECVTQLCNTVALRPAPYSGYAMYADDPTNNGVMLPLAHKDKVEYSILKHASYRFATRSAAGSASWPTATPAAFPPRA